MQLTRRALLGIGVSVVALAGCNRKQKDGSPAPTPRPTTVRTPDATALAAARHDEVALLAAYDHLIARTSLHKRGPLQVERAIHATHLAALEGVETTAARPQQSLPQALRSSSVRLRRLSLAATSGANAALLASIAASHTASAG